MACPYFASLACERLESRAYPLPAADLPLPLRRLLDAQTEPARETAWTEFVQAYSHVLLQVVRSIVHAYDDVMDRYAFILEHLHGNGFGRLRSYAARPDSGFSGWLAVVARRLCLDYHRHQYGRVRPSSGGHAGRAGTGTTAARLVRRRLVDFILVSADGVAGWVGPEYSTPEVDFEAVERNELLERAIARLDPRDRLLLKLRFEDELSVQEIADLLALPTRFQVYRRLRGILACLEAELRAHGLSDGEA